MGRHLGGVGLEAHNVVRDLGVSPDSRAEVSVGQAGLHSRHQQGKLRDFLQTYGWVVLLQQRETSKLLPVC